MAKSKFVVKAYRGSRVLLEEKADTIQKANSLKKTMKKEAGISKVEIVTT